MHPKTAAALAALEKSLLEAARLQRHLTRLGQIFPPVYWQLDSAVLRSAQQLFCALQNEKSQLLLAQKESEKN